MRRLTTTRHSHIPKNSKLQSTHNAKKFHKTKNSITVLRFQWRRSISVFQLKWRRSYSDSDKRSSFNNRWGKASLVNKLLVLIGLFGIILGLPATYIWYLMNEREKLLHEIELERLERERQKDEQEDIEYWEKLAVKQLENPCKVRDEPQYVTRPSLEGDIKQAINTMCISGSRTYYVIIGARGTGKTTCLNEVIKGRPATVVVSIDEHTSPADIGWKVLKQVGITPTKIGGVKPSPLFINICERYNSAHLGEPLPLVVFEITEKTSEDMLIAVTKWCKWMSSDERVCGSVINVSSALLAIALSTDRDARREYIHVGPFTTEEALAYAKKLRPDLDDDNKIIRDYFETLGTQPLILRDALASNNLEAYIEYEYMAKRSDVIDNLDDPRYLRLFQALLDAHNNTLTVEDVSRLDSSIRRDIGESIRAYDVVEYDPLGYVRFSSKIAMEATRQVLKERR